MVVEAVNLFKYYHLQGRKIPALQNITFTVQLNESVAIMGASGSGKSTLLQLLGTLDIFDSGSLKVAGQNVAGATDHQLASFRRKKLGFVFQAFNLMPMLTAKENVAWPLLIDSRPRRESFDKAMHLLKEVNMHERADHYPNQLSGGEMQRVAIARALVNDPSLVLADEPTGALDSKTGNDILELLLNQSKLHGNSMVMVTHDPHAASRCHRTVRMKDGQIHL